LRRVARELNVPLVSANVCTGDGELVAKPIRIVEAAGRRVAMVGVLGQQYATDELQVTTPHQAVLDTLQAAAGRYDTAVVLAYLPEEGLRQFAEMLPEADVVVGGPTGQPVPPVSVGPVLLASATHQGKFLARFDASGHSSPDRWTGTIVELDEQFADHSEQVANLRQFYEQLAKRDFAPADTSFVKPLLSQSPGFQIIGNQSCRDCHPEDFELWESSRHAHAWESLRETGAHVDPECQRCHATGYGLPGGFVSVGRSPDAIHVGCESCHGPSEQHAIDPETHTAYFAQAKDHCTGCHDRENSPEFDYEKYWAKIIHGTSPDSAGTSGKTEGVRKVETPEIAVGNGLCAVPARSVVSRNGTEAVPYSLESPKTLGKTSEEVR
jgi:hypothetical protein